MWSVILGMLAAMSALMLSAFSMVFEEEKHKFVDPKPSTVVTVVVLLFTTVGFAFVAGVLL